MEWKDDDLTPHTVTSAAKQFDFGTINPGPSGGTHLPSQASFPYLCTFHPEMNGLVLVK